MQKKAQIVTFDGSNLVGKSTIIESIGKRLTELDKTFVIAKDNNSISTFITENEDTFCNETKVLLWFASRTKMIEDIILPNMDKVDYILIDRFILSTFLYQGIKSKLLPFLANEVLKTLEVANEDLVEFVLYSNNDALKERFVKQTKNKNLDLVLSINEMVINILQYDGFHRIDTSIDENETIDKILNIIINNKKS